MSRREELEAALIRAHQAGDTRAAQMFADEINALPVEEAELRPLTAQFGAGMERQARRQMTGAKQTFNDISRMVSGKLGTPYSPEREELNRRGEMLNAESRNAPLQEKLGENLLQALEFAAIPMPKGVGGRILANAVAGGISGAFEPNVSAEERAAAMTGGALANAVLPEAISGLGIIGKAGKRIAIPKAGARYELGRELQGAIPESLDYGARPLPAGQEGPPLPRFARVGDVKPTVSMLDPRFAELEANARTRAPMDFSQRDAYNTSKLVEALKSRALPDVEAAAAEDALNATTGPLRERALRMANQARIPRGEGEVLEASVPAQDYADSLANKSGSVEDFHRFITRGKNPYLQGDAEALYQLRKDLGDTLRLNGALDEKATAVKANREKAVRLMQAIDTGLNEATRTETDTSLARELLARQFQDLVEKPVWTQYLAAQSEGMKPIAAGRAFQDVIDKLETAPRVFGTDVPRVGEATLRRALNKETYWNSGKKGLQDILTAQDRALANDAIDLATMMNQARSGGVAVTGSRTGTSLASLMKSGLVPGSGKVATVINLVDALGRSRGAGALDQALLDPDEFAKLLKAYHAEKNAKPSALSTVLGRLGRYAPSAAVINSR